MKQLSRIFLSLALLMPALALADSCTDVTCSNDCNATNNCNSSKVSCNISSCQTSCSQDCCFNSCGTSVCNTSCNNVCGCPTFILKRPTYDNTVIAYGLEYQHQYDLDQGVYGGFQLAFEYQRSFDATNLARGMFGSSVLNFAGSAVAAPAPNSLLADNFGLPTNFVGRIALKPVISDFNIHFDWFVGLDRWAPGLYLQVDMNYDYQMRQLQADCGCELNSTTSTISFPAGYMNAATPPAAVFPILDLQTALLLQQPFGDKQNPTTFGRFDFNKRTKSGLAGLSMNLGYDFVRVQDYFLGAFFRVVAPTGSKVQPCYVFDAVVGNGKGWELGAGISSRWEMWNNNDCQRLTAMLDGYVTSVLKHHSLRTFDFASTNTALRVDYLNCCSNNSCNTSCNTSCNNSCNTSCNTSCNSSCNAACSTSCNTGCTISCDSCNLDSCSGCNTGCTTSGCNSCNDSCGSCNAQNCLTRYSLLKEFNVTSGAYAYAHNLITAADFTTRNVEVRTPVKGDATIRLVYSHGGFDLGFGYNVFGMVSERISSVSAPSSCIFTGTNVFGVKGCQCVAYNNYVISESDDVVTAGPNSIPLISTASMATAYVSGSCGNACAAADNVVAIPTLSTTVPDFAGEGFLNYNAGCSSALLSVGTDVTVLPVDYVQPTDSSTPVVLDGSVNELDLCSGTAPRQFTNKGFISMDYTWVDHCWTPYIGVIAEIEGGTRNTDIAQWGVVLRGGVSY